jgi:uncharacterized protein (TIGR00299 family) protein
MRIAYFDTIAGIAGDMTLGAFLSAGVSLQELRAELQRLGIGGYELEATHVHRSSIAAVQLEVVIADAPHIHRNLAGIRAILDRSSLSERVRRDALAVFTVLAEAEAHVHHTTVEKVHFHEVGALDSIVDIIGAAICLELLGIERVYSSPVRLGRGGLVSTQHGTMPTPAPATIQILRDYPVVLTSHPYELTTPTGAAFLKALSTGVLDDETFRVERVGYGSGTAEIPGLPNMLRLVVGQLEAESEQDNVVIVETNIDDMNPQLYPVVIEALLRAGAHDAYLVPIIMKKGRPGILLSVMAPRPVLDQVIGILYCETSTIGLRLLPVGRRKLPRRHLEVPTSLGRVKAKAVERDGREVLTPEFEECRRLAEEHGMPVVDVLRLLERELATTMNLPQQ